MNFLFVRDILAISISLSHVEWCKLIISKALRHLGSVWYMCLKTENCCLKIFVEIRVGVKVR